MAFDLETDQSRLVIDGVFIVVNKDRRELAVHDSHHDASAGNDLVRPAKQRRK